MLWQLLQCNNGCTCRWVLDISLVLCMEAMMKRAGIV